MISDMIYQILAIKFSSFIYREMHVIEKDEDLTINKISNSIERLSLVTEENISNMQPKAQMLVEDDGRMSISRCSSVSADWQGDMQMNEMNDENIIDDDDGQSSLSFIMKEKLHALTDNIRRRTSQVMQLN